MSVPLFLFCLLDFRHYLVRHGGCLLFVFSPGLHLLCFLRFFLRKWLQQLRGKTQHEVRRDFYLNSIIAVYLKYVFFFFLLSIFKVFAANLIFYANFIFTFASSKNLYRFDSHRFVSFKLMMKKVSSQYDLLIFTLSINLPNYTFRHCFLSFSLSTRFTFLTIKIYKRYT